MGEEVEGVEKQVTKEVKLLAQQTEKCCKDVKSLRKEEAELARNKAPSSDDKKRVIDLRKALQDLEKTYLTQTDSTSERINNILKTTVPDDKKAVAERQKGMDKGHRDLVEKEAGLHVGKDLKVT